MMVGQVEDEKVSTDSGFCDAMWYATLKQAGRRWVKESLMKMFDEFLKESSEEIDREKLEERWRKRAEDFAPVVREFWGHPDAHSIFPTTSESLILSIDRAFPVEHDGKSCQKSVNKKLEWVKKNDN